MKFDKTASLWIKGIAIILMLCNHLFAISEWIFPENHYISFEIGAKTIAAYLGGFSKICVSIYVLLNGIGLYHMYNRSKTIGKGYSFSISRLPSFFFTYWVILVLIFIPILGLTGLLNFDPKNFIMNLFGYETSYCRIAWYVRFYFELVITFPIWIILVKILNKAIIKMSKVKYHKLLLDAFFFLIILLCLLIMREVSINYSFHQIIIEYTEYVPIAILGYYIAKFQVYEKAAYKINYQYKNSLIKVMIYFIILGCIFLFRGLIKSIWIINLDLVYGPIFVFFIWQICRCVKREHNILYLLGNYSTEIWFLHAIFFIGNSTIQKIAYWPKISVFILIWTIIILLPIAFLVRKIKIFLMMESKN